MRIVQLWHNLTESDYSLIFVPTAHKPDSKGYTCGAGKVCCRAHQQTGGCTEGKRGSRETRGAAKESTIGMFTSFSSVYCLKHKQTDHYLLPLNTCKNITSHPKSWCRGLYCSTLSVHVMTSNIIQLRLCIEGRQTYVWLSEILSCFYLLKLHIQVTWMNNTATMFASRDTN